MKFGRNFWSSQVPEWGDDYVDYDALKDQGKSGVGGIPDLEAALNEVQEFSRRQHARVRSRIDAVFKHFNLQRTSAGPKGLEKLSRSQLQDLVAAVEDIGSSLVNLDLYSKTNIDALRRISGKTGQVINHVESIRRLEWTEDLLLVNTVLQLAEEANGAHGGQGGTGPEQRPQFQQDFRGRNVLHYLAEHGSIEALAEALERARAESQLSKALRTRDDAERMPMHIALRRGELNVAELVFQSMIDTEGHERGITSRSSIFSEGGFLALAIRLGHADIATVLMQSPKQLGFRGKHGETPLHLAARAGQAVVIAKLLAARIPVDEEETARGWTPLIFACAGGHSQIAKLLIQSGARPDKLDRHGWSAIDHAAYRGFHKMFEDSQRAHSPSQLVRAPSTRQSATHPLTVPTGTSGTRDLAMHCDREKSHIYAFLGSFNLFKKTQPVDLEPVVARSTPGFSPESHIWLEVSATGCDASDQRYLHRLPILEDLTNNPWHFTTSNPDEATLVFKLFSAVQGETRRDALVGSGLALLASLRNCLGPNKESLVRDFKIPFLGTDGGYTGSITFNFLMTRPLHSAHGPPKPPQSILPTPRTQIGGHRGLGQNNKRQEHLQIGENTMESFESAIRLGAAFVEFDVQVTKDRTPVIYHDFLVSETGTDAVMHDLSYSQFMAISESQSGQQEVPGTERLPWDERARPTVRSPRRSRSVRAPADPDTASLLDRMQRTFEGAASGFVKPNTRGKHIHEPFTTLREMFEKLPETIGFDMEIKYPMLYEAEDFEMDVIAMELNLFLDTILEVVYECAGNRPLFFTSFSPEACMMLATKQRTYPILFLNDSSNWPTGDSRALSTQTAVHFAQRWGLQGVVMASDPFVAAPRLVRFVKDKGLYTSSYGALNDDPASAKIQADAGLDSIIVNAVSLISKAFARDSD